MFSFNSPMGACETCRGFGRTIGIDYGLVVPDESKSLRGGAIRPWQTESYAECQGFEKWNIRIIAKILPDCRNGVMVIAQAELNLAKGIIVCPQGRERETDVARIARIIAEGKHLAWR